MTVGQLQAALALRESGSEINAHFRGRRLMLTVDGELFADMECEETPPVDLTVGMAVLVFGLREEPQAARVEELRNAADSSAVEEWVRIGCTRMALFSYRLEWQEWVFRAVEIGGKWWDSRSKRLAFERIGPV